jgi:peptidoglycan/LPS O-acetylase OafA/YrhL
MQVPVTGGKASQRLLFIDGLRGLAMIAVLFHHFTLRAFANDNIVVPLIHQAWFGVYLFFVLSGFVLYFPYARGARQMVCMADMKTFWRHRSRRLLPLFYFGFFIAFFLQHKNPTGSPRFVLEMVGVPTFLFQFSQNGFNPPSDGVLWTLGVEVLFSAIFPFLIVMKSSRITTPVVIISFLISASAQLANHWLKFRPLGGLPSCLFDFVLGMVVAELVASEKVKLDGKSQAAFFFGLFAMIAGLWMPGAGKLAPFGHVVFVLGCGCLIFSLSHLTNPVLRALIEFWPLRLVGVMCYSIYIWHVPIFFGLYPNWTTMGIVAITFAMPLLLLAVMIVSTLSYRYVEFGQSNDLRSLFLLKPLAASPAERAGPSQMPAGARSSITAVSSHRSEPAN